MTRKNSLSSGISSAIDGASVLVVDDEKHIRLMLRTLLQSDGCTVSEAQNGREALDLIRNVSFDVMILDLNMPVMDGMSVLRELKERPMMKPPRTIVLTAYGSMGAAVRATRLGALDFLEKPASPNEVREAVAAVLREPEPASAAPIEDDTVGGYSAVMARVRSALRESDVTHAESLLMKAADLAQHDAAYFNLLGVIYESRRQWRLARKFYGKAISTDGNYKSAQQNMRRIYELYEFGRSREPVALGDEPEPATALEKLLHEQNRQSRK
ncbi:MAG TPA: response regulator [Tepidisphaeraceae bacterium]|nr:response regulator [Tepidisphaeraceae bacterium]